jgi:hypothetical protein
MMEIGGERAELLSLDREVRADHYHQFIEENKTITLENTQISHQPTNRQQTTNRSNRLSISKYLSLHPQP